MLGANALGLIRVGNSLIVKVLGFLLAVGVFLVILDITLRKVGASLGGTEEISGYLMALMTAWGMSFAFTQHAHIRIEVLLERGTRSMQVVLDALYLVSLTVVTTLIVLKGWPVVEKSILNQSTANTPLETPLWWVQIPWFAGWIWFSLSCWIYLVLFVFYVLRGESIRATQLTRKCSTPELAQ